MTKFDNLPSLYPLGFYHPKYDYDRYESDRFNEFSDRILQLKNRDSSAINYFTNILIKQIEDQEIAIATVPSHTAFKSDSGIRDLADNLVRSKAQYIDAVRCLERFKDVPQSSQTPGGRSKHTHLESIRVKDKQLIENKNVLLIDDIYTTGSSTSACQDILQKAGAREVKIIAIGKTIREVEAAHYLIEHSRERMVEEYEMEHDYLVQKEEDEYNYLFKHLSQELDEDDEERLIELEMEIESNKQKAMSDVMPCEVYKDLLEESANEAHLVLEGKEYFAANNPFLSILLANINP